VKIVIDLLLPFLQGKLGILLRMVAQNWYTGKLGVFLRMVEQNVYIGKLGVFERQDRATYQKNV